MSKYPAPRKKVVESEQANTAIRNTASFAPNSYVGGVAARLSLAQRYGA
jgi:hypothetical protein